MKIYGLLKAILRYIFKGIFIIRSLYRLLSNKIVNHSLFFLPIYSYFTYYPYYPVRAPTDFVRRVLDVYVSDAERRNASANLFLTLVSVITDFVFRCPQMHLAQLLATNTSYAYLYSKYIFFF